MSINNNLFAAKLPELGYHASQGIIPEYSQRNLSFECGCGKKHGVNDTFAIRSHPNDGSAVYVCPEDDLMLTLVEHTGLFSIKGLKTIASFHSDNVNDSTYSRFFIFRNMKESGIESIANYFRS